MKINARLSDELNFLLKIDYSFLQLYLDTANYCLFDDSLIVEFLNSNKIDKDEFNQLICWLLKNKKLKFWVYVFGHKCRIYITLKEPLTFSDNWVSTYNTKELLQELNSIFRNNPQDIVDGNSLPLKGKKLDVILQLLKINIHQDDQAIIDLAQFFSKEVPIYNEIIAYLIKKTNKPEYVKLLNSDEETKKSICAKPNDVYKLFYNYSFLYRPITISFARHNPFFSMYESLFESLRFSIKKRQKSLIGFARNLKDSSENFMRSLQQSNLSSQLDLVDKFNLVIHFAHWLYKLSNHFEQEYYLSEDMQTQLIDYIDFIENYLFYPIIILLSSDIGKEKEYIYENYIRYYGLTHFDFRKICGQIDEDFNKDKTIEQICRKRNKDIVWKLSYIKENSKGKDYETLINNLLKKSKLCYEWSITIKDKFGQIDFIVSDGKNKIITIECKTGKKSMEVNELKKLYSVNKLIQVKNSFFITNNAKPTKTDIENTKNIAEILGIKFMQVNEKSYLALIEEIHTILNNKMEF